MKNISNKILVFCILAISLCFTLNACSNDDDDQEKEYPGTTMFKTKYSRSKILHNPLNGWVMYASGTGDESYWDTEFYVPDLGKKVKVRDYASACYIRTSWANMNPSDGVYAWRDPNTKIGKMIEGARKRGLPIAFRFVVDGRDQGMNTPGFVFEAGAASYLENSSYPTRITPIPQDPIFQQYYTKFIQELAKDFNDPAICAFIDAYGLGKWGEAHNVIYEDPNTSDGSNTERLKEEVFEWITDVYTQNFTQVPLVINYHRVVGHPASDGDVNPNTNKLLTMAINKGYSLRQDAFGMTDYYKAWEKSFAKTWNYLRPIIMEGGWITDPGHAHRPETDSSGKYRAGHPEDVRQGEFDASMEARVNMMDFRVGYETETWFTLCFGLIQRFSAEGGYRLYPDRIYLPESVEKGVETMIAHRWRNMGWGYFPNNIPQWNYRYKVAFALLDSDDNVQKILVDANCEPSGWLKDKAALYEFKTSIDLPAGNYKWAVAIVDTKGDNKPAIELAVNEEITDEGWVKLLDVQVK